MFEIELQSRPDHAVHQRFQAHILAAVRLFTCQRAFSQVPADEQLWAGLAPTVAGLLLCGGEADRIDSCLLVNRLLRDFRIVAAADGPS